MQYFKKQGFTLLETLFALVIITTGFFAVFSLMKTSISATESSINDLIAANLAQESVEILRNIRDSVYDEGNGWSVIIDNGHFNRHNCLWEPTDPDSEQCRVQYNREQLLNESDEYLKIDDGEYQYDTGDNTKFKRWVSLKKEAGICTQIATSTDCIQINTTVEWRERGQNKTLEVENYLYSWY